MLRRNGSSAASSVAVGPYVGALTMELQADTDSEVAAWIAAGRPPIFFGFGSITVKSPAELLKIVSTACAQLGERALIYSAATDCGDTATLSHVKVVKAMNYAAVFPACRAVVHHGGTGTTAASLRAGVPTLILSADLDQTIWGVVVKRLKVGTARRLSGLTKQSLISALGTVLAPECAARARDIAQRMTKPAASVKAAVDLVETIAAESPMTGSHLQTFSRSRATT